MLIPKGKWLISIINRVADGSVSLPDAIAFVAWRIRHTESIKINNLYYHGVDHILWALIAETHLRREYTPRGFEIRPDFQVVVDIGAHRGAFVGFAARRTSGQILALEPDSQNFDDLRRFIEYNRLDNVRILNSAISDHDGYVLLYQSASSRHTVTGIDQATGVVLQQSVKVNAVSLDTLLKPFSQIDFLKMDCEGAEYAAFSSASDETLRKINILSMEVHSMDQQDSLGLLLARIKTVFPIVSVRKMSPTLGILNARLFNHH